jgi:ankyrin repeat protein
MGNSMELDFPMAFFLQVKQEIMSDINVIEKKKAIWLAVRNSLEKANAYALDKEFKAAFEKGNYFQENRTDLLQDTFKSLQKLVEKGAAATLLRNHELGTFNLAMLIQRIPQINDTLSLDWVTEIIKLTIIAGANLKAQKAYAGNGGATSLEWVCLYLADGVRDTGYIRSLDQYYCCYKIFPLLLESGMHSNGKRLNPFNTFMAALRDSPEVADYQEEIMLAMMYYGFSPFTPNDIYQSASFFSRIAAINVKWLSWLFPYEDEHVKHYLSVLQPNVTAEVVKNLINGFTSNNKTRKHFKAFFSIKAHWLLQYIIESMPEVIFGLVKRNEQDMLIPFLKNFKPAMITLREANGNTLLHQAVLCRGLVENTIQLLRNARLSLEAINNDGLTPLALAMKNNRTDLIKWLQ